MHIKSLEIPDIKLVTPRRITDERGWFCESYSKADLSHCGLNAEFVQDNHSHSKCAGTVRGLHYQSPPRAQTKLVRVLRGSILDVAVDVRIGSPTNGKWVSAKLSAENGAQLLVPVGFLHGFITLEPDTEVAYKVSDFYSKEHEGSIRWDDPDLEIDWGELSEVACLSIKDAAAPFYKCLDSSFRYGN
jgi:dTDP-4-dehydrorhamnose 3,5-epimerase